MSWALADHAWISGAIFPGVRGNSRLGTEESGLNRERVRVRLQLPPGRQVFGNADLRCWSDHRVFVAWLHLHQALWATATSAGLLSGG